MKFIEKISLHVNQSKACITFLLEPPPFYYASKWLGDKIATSLYFPCYWAATSSLIMVIALRIFRSCNSINGLTVHLHGFKYFFYLYLQLLEFPYVLVELFFNWLLRLVALSLLEESISRDGNILRRVHKILIW